MNFWYRRNGKPYPKGEKGMFEVEKDLRNFKNRIVKQETLPNRRWVSTVWLGLDYGFMPKKKPLIFETMVFPRKGNYKALDSLRYSSEAQAKRGHRKMCEKWAAEKKR